MLFQGHSRIKWQYASISIPKRAVGFRQNVYLTCLDRRQLRKKKFFWEFRGNSEIMPQQRCMAKTLLTFLIHNLEHAENSAEGGLKGSEWADIELLCFSTGNDLVK